LDYRLPVSPRAKFLCLQRWEGTVIKTGDTEFVVRLQDLSSGGMDEEAALLLSDVSPDDRELVQAGAVFYLNIGYHISLTGQLMRGMKLRFQRMPRWTADEILDARERARTRLGQLVCD